MADTHNTFLTFHDSEALRDICTQLRSVHSTLDFASALSRYCVSFDSERREHAKLFTLTYLATDTAKCYSSIIAISFWDELWPYIISRAEQFHVLFPSGVPHLNNAVEISSETADTASANSVHTQNVCIPTHRGADITASIHSVLHIYSRAQAACLLANMLLCIVPNQSERFNRAHFLHSLAYKTPANITKLQMLLKYFEILYTLEPSVPAGSPVYVQPLGSISLRRLALHYNGTTLDTTHAHVNVHDMYHMESETAVPRNAISGATGAAADEEGTCRVTRLFSPADSADNNNNNNPASGMATGGMALDTAPPPGAAGIDGSGAMWALSAQPLMPFEGRLDGTIEAAPYTYIRADFANKYIGGGVLGQGAVQEEIMFVEAPELLISCLLCPVMQPHEAILLTGAPQLFEHTGYGDTFKYAGLCTHAAPTFGELGVSVPEGLHPSTAACVVVAMDALPFPRGVSVMRQISGKSLHRELTKAFVAFASDVPECSHQEFPGIATGRWGCGAFNGSTVVKLLVQWLAASQAKRNMQFYAFGDMSIIAMTKALQEACLPAGVTVGQAYQVLRDLEDEASSAAYALRASGSVAFADEHSLFDAFLARVSSLIPGSSSAPTSCCLPLLQ